MCNKTICIQYNARKVFNTIGKNNNNDSRYCNDKYEIDCGPEEPKLEEYIERGDC